MEDKGNIGEHSVLKERRDSLDKMDTGDEAPKNMCNGTDHRDECGTDVKTDSESRATNSTPDSDQNRDKVSGCNGIGDEDMDCTNAKTNECEEVMDMTENNDPEKPDEEKSTCTARDCKESVLSNDHGDDTEKGQGRDEKVNEQEEAKDSGKEKKDDAKDSIKEKKEDQDAQQKPMKNIDDHSSAIDCKEFSRASPISNQTAATSAVVCDQNEEKPVSRSVTPIQNDSTTQQIVSSSGTPLVVMSSSRSGTPSAEKENDPDNKKKSRKPSKVSQVLKGATSQTMNLRPIAQLLFDIGMDVTRQYVYRDLIKIQKKKESMDKLDDKEIEQLEKLHDAYNELLQKNESFMNDVVHCSQCGYKTDSKNVLELHMEYAHNQEYNMFTCSFCNESTRVASQYLYHVEAVHNRKGRIFMKHAFFVCPYCPYESNSRGPFQKHVEKCTKNFKEQQNLVPLAPDCDIPLKQVIKPADKKVQKSVAKPPTKPSIVKPKAPVPTTIQRFQTRPQIPTVRPSMTPPITRPAPPPPTNQIPAQLLRPVQPKPPAPVQPPTSTPASPAGQDSGSGAAMVQMNGQWYRLAMIGTQQFLMPVPPPSANQMPQNRPQIIVQNSPTGVTHVPPQASVVAPSGSFEVCEICGGFVKDRESLRVHFFWAHKVDIHKDVFKAQKPPLNCPLCMKAKKETRFWTYQGLSRHRGNEHKNYREPPKETEFSSLMKEIPKQCVVCKHVYPNSTTVQQYWAHMEVHGITPVKLFLLKKCLICGVAVPDSNRLERHLLTAHSTLFRNLVMNDNTKSGSDKDNNKTTVKSPVKKQNVCNMCNMSFDSQDMYIRHCNTAHTFKCSRCEVKLSSREVLMKHFHDDHGNDKDECPICHRYIRIGRPMVRHMKSEHITNCSVTLPRLSESEAQKYLSEMKNNNLSSDSVKSTLDKTTSKRKMSAEMSENVVIIDLESPPRAKVTKTDIKPKEKPKAKKQILEVDGEEIVVEIQQDDDDESDDQSEVVVADSSPPSTSSKQDDNVLSVNGEEDDDIQEIVFDDESGSDKMEVSVGKISQDPEDEASSSKISTSGQSVKDNNTKSVNLRSKQGKTDK